MNIYVDSKLVDQQKTAAKLVSTAVSLSPGTHAITVRAWDASTDFSKSITIKVK
jgi:hypothetical protein